MFDVKRIREDFPLLKTKMQGHPLIYFDNGATSLKPQVVIQAINDYYTKLGSNSHRADYDLSYYTSEAIEATRKEVASFINARPEEIIFTSGTTAAINGLAIMLKKFLKKGDEIILSYHEHAANTLPWFALQQELGLVIKYVELTKNGEITTDNLRRLITKQTRIISLALISNVMGVVSKPQKISNLIKDQNIIYIIDAAQAAPHEKIDVKAFDCDFLVFSAHKMLGPTGVGVLYGKMEQLESLDPYLYGGSMNDKYDKTGKMSYLNVPTKFEAGTPNISNIIAFKAAIMYLKSIGMEQIREHELMLREYVIQQLIKEVPKIIIYNKEIESNTVIFNIDGVFAQDVATYLNSYGIAIRSGEHCAKLLHYYLGVGSTLRLSFYLYNTKEEVDVLVAALKAGGDFLDGFFK
ncbi:MAG: aminotransferase class V-fold PLP-dependent enzyme [Erysipelotrichaceae bacterium]|jgi:cysteine desulfurase/selenocysteine lyase|nr:aminotransferase class V-fold PLP-dependent enzyme [Erysipelotrichaceae bacterium]